MQTTFKYKTVMVIDDTMMDRYIAEKIMHKYLFAEHVINMESAMEALKYLDSLAPEADAVPKVIFLDIRMPETDGFGFLEKFEKLPDIIKENCSIIMLTSSTHPEDKRRAENNPFVKGFLSKPLNAEKLGQLNIS